MKFRAHVGALSGTGVTGNACWGLVSIDFRDPLSQHGKRTNVPAFSRIIRFDIFICI